MPAPIPLLFIGDNPALSCGGLSRIGRDLATLASRLPEFRVGFMGRGGTGTRQVPFALYPFDEGSRWGEWGELLLPHVWQDFAGDMRGIVFTIWDPSRLSWFSCPSVISDEYAGLRQFLSENHFARWGYFPIDSIGPGGRLPVAAQATLLGYDRILTYTEWARDLVAASLGDDASMHRGLDYLPHGLKLATFTPQDRREARGWNRLLHANDMVLGVVATNQARKDWGLVAMVCRILRDAIGESFRAWWHSDRAVRHWNLTGLIQDYGLQSCVSLTLDAVSDSGMARRYSACDVTMHPGCEGFGYPIAESLACGVPAVHMNYAGGAELLKSQSAWLVEPVAMRLDTPFNLFRPVFDAQAWAETIMTVLAEGSSPEACRTMVEHLDWGSGRLWNQWRKWFMGGLR